MSKIVDRTMDFFELFAQEKRPLTLSEIARSLGIPLSSCHDVISALRERGYVYQVNARDGFYVTRRMFDLMSRATQVDLTLQRAEPILRSLRDTAGETVALARGQGASLTYVLVLQSLHNFSVAIYAGSPVRAYHATSAGKAFLGGWPAVQQRAYLSGGPLESLTGNTKTNVEEVLADIDASARTGIYYNHEESVEGVTTLSGRFESGGVSYTVTVTGPSVRTVPRLDELSKLVGEVCRELASDLELQTTNFAL